MPSWRRTRCLAEYAFSLEGDDADLAGLADSLFSAAPEAPAGAVPQAFRLVRRSGTVVLLEDGRAVCRAPDLQGLFLQVEWHLTRAVMAALGRYLQLHGAAVVLPSGAVLAVGPPESGKTSLALGMALGGGRLAGDEVALVGPSGLRVTPFPRDLIVHDGTRALFPGRLAAPAVPAWKVFPGYVHAAPGELGLRTARRPAAIRRLVFPVRGGQGGAACRPVGPAEAARRLLEQVFSLPGQGARGVEIVGRLAEECAPVEVPCDDAATAARLLLDLAARG
ncbi:MAG: hypothetical protein AB1505_12250 [Candidatus Latescibacterota bacterium]